MTPDLLSSPLMTSDPYLGLKSAEKIRAVIAMWEPISLAAAGPRGSRFMIGMSTGPVPKIWEVEVSEEEKAVAKIYQI